MKFVQFTRIVLVIMFLVPKCFAFRTRVPRKSMQLCSLETNDPTSAAMSLLRRGQSISKMDESAAKAELELLDSTIKYHDKLYYELDTPIISDSIYDRLVRRTELIVGKFSHLESLVAKLQQVGGARNVKFPPFVHVKQMLSLGNAFSDEEILKLTTKVLAQTLATEEEENSTPKFVIEQKIDGLSLALRYEMGVLTSGGTRGDGFVGEDVTSNLKYVKGVPTTIPNIAKNVEVRGEVYIGKEDFRELNAKRAIANLTIFSTPRNAAAGSLRQAKLSPSTDRGLRFFAYDIESHNEFPEVQGGGREDASQVPGGEVRLIHPSSKGPKYGEAPSKVRVPSLVAAAAGADAGGGSTMKPTTQAQKLELLGQLGFEVARPWYACTSAEEVLARCRDMERDRDKLGFDVDGAVIKANTVRVQHSLGAAKRFPKWALAFKFVANEVVADLVNISVQVGRTGLLTPVAHLLPVKIGGVTVERATLHNEREVNRLGLGKYFSAPTSELVTNNEPDRPHMLNTAPTTSGACKVILVRSGEVIPKIVAMLGEHGERVTTSSLVPEGADVFGEKVEAKAMVGTGGAAAALAASVDRDIESFCLPDKCPVCGSPTEREPPGILVRCTGGLLCPAQAVEGIRHFCSRDALDIEGLGPSKIEQLYELGILRTPLDVFKLRQMDISSHAVDDDVKLFDLRSRKGWGDRSVNNLLAAIDKKRTVTFARLLCGLGVRHVGLETSKQIAETFQSFEEFWQYLHEQADAVRGQAREDVESTDAVGDGDADAISRNILLQRLRDSVMQTQKDVVKARTRSRRPVREESSESASLPSPMPVPVPVQAQAQLAGQGIGHRLMVAMDGIGAKVAESLIAFAMDPRACSMVEGLMGELCIVSSERARRESQKGVALSETAVSASAIGNGSAPTGDVVQGFDGDGGEQVGSGSGGPSSSAMRGKRVVFTGKLTQLTRSAAAALCEQCGGEVMSGVTRETNLVVIGSKNGTEPPSAKERRAESMGVEIWGEQRFLAECGNDD